MFGGRPGWALPLAALVCTTVAEPVAAASQRGAQRGEASWYGEFHQGKPMANRRPFRMMQATVAHRTLPLGSVVEVHNLRNGRKARAEVTDRGPYARGRVLDVSKGMAQRLDMLRPGTAPVEIRVLRRQERPAAVERRASRDTPRATAADRRSAAVAVKARRT